MVPVAGPAFIHYFCFNLGNEISVKSHLAGAMPDNANQIAAAKDLDELQPYIVKYFNEFYKLTVAQIRQQADLRSSSK